MRRHHQILERARRLLVAALLATASVAGAVGPVVEPPFDDHFTLVDLGAIDDLPVPYGGFAFVPGDPDAIVIGGWANTEMGFLYAAGVRRDVTGSISGFTAATPLADAYGISGGVTHAPDGVLFYTRVTFALGQIEPDSSTTDKVVDMRSLVWPPSGIDFVPDGLGGAGQLKALTRAYGEWWSLATAPDGNGTHDVTGATKGPSLPGNPQGFDYVAPDAPGPLSPGLVVCETALSYGAGNVVAYDVDEHGDPILASRRVIVSGLDVPNGVGMDPATGDVLFVSYVGRMYVLRSTPLPTTTSTTTSTTTTTKPTTTSTSTTFATATTTSTSTSLPTTTTSTTRPVTTSTTTATTTSTTSTSIAVPTTTTTSTTAPRPTSTTTRTPTTTTSTTIPAACGGGEASLPSLACRVDALLAVVRDATGLGELQATFVARLERAQATVAIGVERCAEGRRTLARTALERLEQQMLRIRARTRTARARKTIPKALAEQIGNAARALAADARALREVIACP